MICYYKSGQWGIRNISSFSRCQRSLYFYLHNSLDWSGRLEYPSGCLEANTGSKLLPNCFDRLRYIWLALNDDKCSKKVAYEFKQWTLFAGESKNRTWSELSMVLWTMMDSNTATTGQNFDQPWIHILLRRNGTAYKNLDCAWIWQINPNKSSDCSSLVTASDTRGCVLYPRSGSPSLDDWSPIEAFGCKTPFLSLSKVQESPKAQLLTVLLSQSWTCSERWKRRMWARETSAPF